MVISHTCKIVITSICNDSKKNGKQKSSAKKLQLHKLKHPLEIEEETLKAGIHPSPTLSPSPPPPPSIRDCRKSQNCFNCDYWLQLSCRGRQENH